MLKQYFLALLITATTHLALAVFVFSRGPRRLTNITYALYSTAIAWWSGLEAFAITTPASPLALGLWRLNHVGVIFIPIFFVHFVMSLLEDADRRRRRPVMLFGYLAGLGLLALDATPLFIATVVPKFSFRHFITPGPLYPIFFVGWVGWALYGLQLLFRVYARSSGVRRNQLRYFCWSMLIAYGGGAPNFLPTFNIEIPLLMPFGTYAIAIYAFFTTYAIVRYRLMDVNLAITRTAVFMAVYALVLGVPLLMALSLQSEIERWLGPRWWVWLLMAYAVLATAAHYANLYLQQKAEDRLLAEQRRYQETLRRASQGMATIRDLSHLLRLTVGVLTKTVRLTHAAVYLQDNETKRYLVQAVRGRERPLESIALDPDDPLLQYLALHKSAIVADELRLQQEAEPGLRGVEQTLRRVGAALVIPSFVHDHLLGFVILGAKRSGRIYTDDDLKVLMTLANQAALAVENAQFYDELQHTQADLFQTAKMATLGQMAGGMSHQINNRFYVLSILSGTMKAALNALTLEGVGQDVRAAVVKSKETFQKIEDNAIRGGDIVKTLLRFSRPTRGDQKPISIQEIVDTALDVVQYKIKLEELDFTKEYDEGLPRIQGNVNQLADSLFNLFSNAYDAIQSKQERLKPPDYRGAITVRARAVSGRVTLTIHDNGIGMTPPEAAQLFIPFFTTKATAEKGTGLGLFIIKRIVEHHGGQIQATSQFGEGTTFTITLPAAPPAV